MFRIVAIEREYACGAADISKALAERLNWKLWDHEIRCEIARQLKCDTSAVERREERLDPAFYRLMKIFMRGSYEGSWAGHAGMELLDAESLSVCFERVVKSIAEKGSAVIIGRAAPWFLRERADTFRVFLYAPYDFKLNRMIRNGKNRAESEAELDTVDRERAAFVKKYYDKDWPVRQIYHMMINSEMGQDAVIETVLSTMELLERIPALAGKA